MPCRSRPLVLVVALLLGGCSTGTAFDDIQTIWGGESRADEARRTAATEARTNQVPIEAVRGVEVGRTRDGFLITAYGTAPGLGYSSPRLRPRRGGAPGADGYVEYDFVASEPPPGFNLPAGTARTRTMRADLPIRASELRGAAGIRVLAARGGAQLNFGATPPPPDSAGQQS